MNLFPVKLFVLEHWRKGWPALSFSFYYPASRFSQVHPSANWHSMIHKGRPSSSLLCQASLTRTLPLAIDLLSVPRLWTDCLQTSNHFAFSFAFYLSSLAHKSGSANKELEESGRIWKMNCNAAPASFMSGNSSPKAEIKDFIKNQKKNKSKNQKKNQIEKSKKNRKNIQKKSKKEKKRIKSLVVSWKS